MDKTDLAILATLQHNGRATQLEIAQQVSLSQPAVAERIRKLEERGIIKRYAAIVDASAFGKDITAFISVGMEHPKYFDHFSEAILALPEVLECHRVAGNESYVLKVKTANTKTLDDLLVKRIRMIKGVTQTVTTIVLSSIKEETAIQISQPK